MLTKGLFTTEKLDCDVQKIRSGITNPATLKYRLEDEIIADFVREVKS